MFIPNLQVCADTRNKAIMTSPVFNIGDVVGKLHVHLPMDPYNLGVLESISEEVDFTKKSSTIDLSKCEIFTAHPWLDIDVSALNLDIGHHNYQLKYFNHEFGTYVILYFTYIIQNDNPDRPYYYMPPIEADTTDTDNKSDENGSESN